jgi:hypothetical protein
MMMPLVWWPTITMLPLILLSLPLPPSPFQAARAEHSLSIFSARMQKQSIPEEAETPLWSLIATLVPPLHPTDITAEAALMLFGDCHSVIHSQFLAHLLLVTARYPVVITALTVAFKSSMRFHQTVLLLDSS